MNVRISENLEPGLRGPGHKTSQPKGMKRNFGGKRYGKALISRLRHSKKVRPLANTPFFGVVCRLSSYGGNVNWSTEARYRHIPCFVQA